MANSEAWTNLGEIGKLLYIQKYAIEEIQSLKPKPGMSAETAQEYKERLHNLFALFMFNQERINSDINPTHHRVQVDLTERIRNLVTSYLRKLIPIIGEPFLIELYPNSDSPSVLNFPSTWTPETKMQDWVAYENYLILSQKVRDFNILCSAVPHDILPLIKRFDKEGATVFELERIVNKIRSDIDFDSLIEAELKTIWMHPPFDKNSIEGFRGFVETANEVMRMLIVCNAEVEDWDNDWAVLMVEQITHRFPRVVKDKCAKELSQEGDVSMIVKLRNFLKIPAQDLMHEDEKNAAEGEKYAVVERRWFWGNFGRFLNTIFSMFRWW